MNPLTKKYLSILMPLFFLNTHPMFDAKIVSTKMIHNHATYSVYDSATIPFVAHVVIISPEALSIELITAYGQREEVSSIAQRTNASIAINGSNYRRGGKYNGNRVNLLCLHGNILSDLSLKRGALIASDEHTLTIATVSLKKELIIGERLCNVDAINQPRETQQSVLYTNNADLSLLAHNPGTNILVNEKGSIKSISTEIPRSINQSCFLYQTSDETIIQHAKKGMTTIFSARLNSLHNSPTLEQSHFVLGGAGLLIENETIVSTHLYDEFSQGNAIVHCGDEIAADFSTRAMQEWLVEQRHPRTAIGLTKNNDVCIVVVDGRQTASEGLTLHELAEFMYQLGCTDALNIGGGGCSTLYIEGKVVNNPSTNGEGRPVSEALCFYKK